MEPTLLSFTQPDRAMALLTYTNHKEHRFQNRFTFSHTQACDQLETKQKENLATPQATPPALIIKNMYFSTLKDISHIIIHTIVL